MKIGYIRISTTDQNIRILSRVEQPFKFRFKLIAQEMDSGFFAKVGTESKKIETDETLVILKNPLLSGDF